MSRKYLAHQMVFLRDLLGAQHTAMTETTNKAGKTVFVPTVGFVGHQHDSFAGHRIFEITNATGGERSLAEGMKLQECIRFVEGCIMGLEQRVQRYI